MATVLDEMDKLYDEIHTNRCKIADWKKEKIEQRAKAWEKATGIAEQKKDYVRSAVSDFDADILKAEAEIEKAYGKLKVAELRLEHE